MEPDYFRAMVRRGNVSRLVYKYGMRLRGCSIGTQPNDGFIEREDDPLGEYWDVIVYNRPLTEKEIKGYDLDYLGARRIP